MKPCRKEEQSREKPREISEKELNEIMKAVGERTRAQSVELKEIMKDNLRREFASARAAFLAHGKKSSQA